MYELVRSHGFVCKFVSTNWKPYMRGVAADCTCADARLCCCLAEPLYSWTQEIQAVQRTLGRTTSRGENFCEPQKHKNSHWHYDHHFTKDPHIIKPQLSGLHHQISCLLYLLPVPRGNTQQLQAARNPWRSWAASRWGRRRRASGSFRPSTWAGASCSGRRRGGSRPRGACWWWKPGGGTGRSGRCSSSGACRSSPRSRTTATRASWSSSAPPMFVWFALSWWLLSPSLHCILPFVASWFSFSKFSGAWPRFVHFAEGLLLVPAQHHHRRHDGEDHARRQGQLPRQVHIQGHARQEPRCRHLQGNQCFTVHTLSNKS